MIRRRVIRRRVMVPTLGYRVLLPQPALACPDCGSRMQSREIRYFYGSCTGCGHSWHRLTGSADSLGGIVVVWLVGLGALLLGCALAECFT